MTTKITPRLEVDLGALRANYRVLCHQSQGGVGAVVKADAYGLGLTPVVDALWDAGCRTFFVAFTREGVLVRKSCPEAEVYVLAPSVEADIKDLVQHRLKPCLYSLDSYHFMSQWCAQQQSVCPVSLHVDTGINRLGFTDQEFQQVVEQPSPDLTVDLLMSHLACADDPASSYNEKQKAKFLRFRSLMPDVKASLANSGGVFLDPSFHFDLVRPGLALFGCDPHYSRLASPRVRPVARLVSEVAQIKTAVRGEGVGYGTTVILEQDTRIGVVMGGYADGINRLLGESSGPYNFFVAGSRAPLLGRVSMDSCTLDLSDQSLSKVSLGDVVEFFGPNLPIEDLAKHVGTIPYEVLTQVGQRVARCYVSDAR